MGNIAPRTRRVKLLSAATVNLLFCISAYASGPPQPPPLADKNPDAKLWLTSGFLSYHFDRDADYNERNTGIGVEWQRDAEHSISAGVYRNSVRRRSHYLQYVWTPLSFGAMRLGGALGVLDGYPELNNGNLSLLLIPVVNLDFKLLGHDAGVNLVYIPTIAKEVDGALAVQFKLRIR